MSEQTIQSRDINVAAVFQDFYAVPDYQREYVWGSEEVEQLLNDISGELGGGDPVAAPEYFIGSIVVCEGRDGTLDLIDGQQRMTTLFLVLCAIRDELRSLGQQPPAALDGQIHSVSTDVSGNDRFRYRMDLQYQDSGDVLKDIATGQIESIASKDTRSVENLRNAYEVSRGFLRRELGDAGRMRAFYGYLTNKVKLIRIQTEDVAKALKIFETINDRGVGLDAMDLLKNLLFMKASRAEFDRLKTVWKQMQDTLHVDIKEKPLRFLRYFIFSQYDVEVLREDEIYGWLSRNEPRVGYAQRPVKFAQELLEAAQAYRNFLRGVDQHGAKNRYLEALRLLGGRSARQHLILLLAGRHLSPTLFDRLAQEVEELFFVYVITREPTRDFERDFARWAAEVRAVNDEASFQALVDRRFRPAKAKLSDRFDDTFHRLYSDSVQAYRLRYLLAKLTQRIELDAYGETESTKWLGQYADSAFEVEHIYPQDPSTEARDEFGSTRDALTAQRLGNLALVEKSINSSLGNRPFSKKRLVYPKSKLLLTQAIAERPQIGVDTRIDRAVADLEPFDSWNDASVERRQAELTKLARRAWNVPVP